MKHVIVGLLFVVVIHATIPYNIEEAFSVQEIGDNKSATKLSAKRVVMKQRGNRHKYRRRKRSKQHKQTEVLSPVSKQSPKEAPLKMGRLKRDSKLDDEIGSNRQIKSFGNILSLPNQIGETPVVRYSNNEDTLLGTNEEENTDVVEPHFVPDGTVSDENHELLTQMLAQVPIWADQLLQNNKVRIHYRENQLGSVTEGNQHGNILADLASSLDTLAGEQQIIEEEQASVSGKMSILSQKIAQLNSIAQKIFEEGAFVKQLLHARLKSSSVARKGSAELVHGNPIIEGPDHEVSFNGQRTLIDGMLARGQNVSRSEIRKTNHIRGAGRKTRSAVTSHGDVNTIFSPPSELLAKQNKVVRDTRRQNEPPVAKIEEKKVVEENMHYSSPTVRKSKKAKVKTQR